MDPDYSIIIPAFNEENFLPATLSSLAEAMEAAPGSGEVIVVDNNSSDATAAIAEAWGARVVFEPVNQISRARNAGGREARGRYLVFLDADTCLTRELLVSALDLLATGRCCGGGTLVRADRELTGWLASLLEFWNRLSLRNDWAAGCFIFCLRQAFEVTGGFSERVYASEEIWFSRQLRRWGKESGMRFVVISEPGIVTSMRKLQWYTAPQIIRHLLTLVFFPPAIFFRGLCSGWYSRPPEQEDAEL